MRRVSLVALFFGLLAVSAVQQVQAGLVLPPATPTDSQQFGDFTVYSLNFLENKYGSGFSVPSSPGQIQDGVVIATGANGQQVNTNVLNLDNAYGTPSGNGAPHFFDTLVQPPSDPNFPEPDNGPGAANTGAPGGANDGIGTWDGSVSVLRDFLNTSGGDLVFLFNLNETNPQPDYSTEEGRQLIGQEMVAWAKVELIDTTGGQATKTYFFSAADNPLTPGTDELADGLAASLISPPNPNPANGEYVDSNGVPLQDQWGYVHGQITVDSTTGAFVHFGAPLPGEVGVKAINQNLGANEAAFALFNQELNDLVKDPTSGYNLLRARIMFGGVDNGFEQLFILADNVVTPPIPEPSSLFLATTGLIGLVGYARRRRTQA